MTGVEMVALLQKKPAFRGLLYDLSINVLALFNDRGYENAESHALKP